jgi:hypothetical protein
MDIVGKAYLICTIVVIYIHIRFEAFTVTECNSVFKDSQLCECEVYIQFWRLFLHPLLGSDEMDVGHATVHCLYQYNVNYHSGRIADRLL